jgi:hypothetical protein
VLRTRAGRKPILLARCGADVADFAARPVPGCRRQAHEPVATAARVLDAQRHDGGPETAPFAEEHESRPSPWHAELVGGGARLLEEPAALG